MSVSASKPNFKRLSPLSRSVLQRQLSVLVVAAFALGVVVAVLYLQNRKHERGLREQQGQHRVDVSAEFISREIGAVRSDLLYLAEQETLKRFLSGRKDARSDVESEYSRFARRKVVYDQIRYLDSSGKEIIRVNFRNGQPEVVPVPELQDKDDRYYFRQSLSLKRDEVFVSDFDLNVERGAIERPLKPVVRFVTPVFDANGEKRGMLVLNYLGSQLLSRLNEVSLPGSTLLVNSDGEYLRGPSLDDAWGWILGHERTFAKQFPDAWRRLREHSENHFQIGEGFFAFRRIALSGSRPSDSPALKSALHHSNSHDSSHPEMSLVLVSYLPTDEVYVASNKLLRQLLLMGAGAMLLVMILSKYWVQSAVIRGEQAQRIVDSESRLRTLSTQLLAAQETERRSISREIHDELGQQVTAISLDLQLAARQDEPERARSLLQRAIEEAGQLLKNLHEIASRVRPAVLDDLGFREAVESFVSDFQQRTGITIDAKLSLQAISIPSSIGENAYRVLQEALTNVAKHAKVNQISLTGEADSDTLRIIVEDEGVGFDSDQVIAPRLGILGMQERVELLGGEFTLMTAPGTGTRISVTLPLRDAS